MTDEIELKRVDASLEDVLGDLEKYETRSDAVAEVCRMAARTSALEALLAECKILLAPLHLMRELTGSDYLEDVTALLAKLKKEL